MIEAARVDWPIRPGTNADLEFQLLDDDGVTPKNLTGITIIFRVPYSNTTLTLSSASSGVTIDDAAMGEFTVPLTPAHTRAFPVGRVGPYEIELREGSRQDVYIEGYFAVSGGSNSD